MYTFLLALVHHIQSLREKNILYLLMVSDEKMIFGVWKEP